jgi:hypothetical protein
MPRLPLLTTVFLMLVAPVADAKVIFVTTGADLVDFAGGCTLRDAVRSANDDLPRGGCAAGVGDDEIQLPVSKITLTRTGAYDDLSMSGDLDVSGGALTVRGSTLARSVIDAGGVDRVFETDSPLTIENVTISGGRPGPDGTLGVNVAKSYGGAILSRSSLTITGSTFEDNATADGVVGSKSIGGSGGDGGAIAAIGSGSGLTISDSVFRDNHTGNGAAKPGGGLSAGRGGSGGALAAGFGAALTVTDSEFTANSTGAGGAGDGSFAIGGAGSAISGGGVITNTVITGNTVGADNSTTGYQLGGAVAGGTLRHVTVSGNKVDGLAPGTASGVSDASVHASVITGSGTVCAGAMTDDGDNVSLAGIGCPGAGSDPALDDNLIPAADSRAIDHATGPCPAADVRGVTRPQGAACDAGAIERRPTTLSLEPASLAFGAFLPGAMSAAKPAELTYTGDGAFKLGAASASGDFSASGCSGAIFVDHGSCSVAVTFGPTAAGIRTGTLSVATPVGARTASLTGIGLGTSNPPPGGSQNTQGAARASIKSATLRRSRGRLRLRIGAACPSGGDRCAESLRVRVARAGRKAFFATVRLSLAAGARKTVGVALPRGLIRGLRRGTRLSVRLRLVKRGQKTLESKLSRRLP